MSNEEEEFLPWKPTGGGSASKKRHESEEEDEELEDEWGDDLMGDDKDRAWLQSLSNLERETVLAERFTKRKEMEERRKAKARITRQQSRKVSKTSGSSDTRAGRLSARRKEIESRYAEDDEYGGPETTSLSSRGISSADSGKTDVILKAKTTTASSSASSSVLSEQRRGVVPPEEQATYEEAQSIRINRSKLLQWQNEPFFEKTVVGCLVRVNIGVGADQQPMYRVAKVAEVKRKTQTYVVDNTESGVHLVLAIADSLKQFKLSAISNQEIQANEFTRWMRTLADQSIQPLSKQEVKQKIEDIKQAINYVYSEDQVAELVNKRREDETKLPINVLRQKKAETQAQIVVALDKNDVALARSLQEKVQDLTSLIEVKSQQLEKDSTLLGVAFNVKVREAKFKTSGDGLDDYYKEDDVVGENKTANPFVRRRTIQHVMHVGEEAERKKREEEELRKKQEEEEKAAEEAKRKKEERRAADPLLADMHALKRKKHDDDLDEVDLAKGLSGVQKQLEEAHNFELTIDI